MNNRSNILKTVRDLKSKFYEDPPKTIKSKDDSDRVKYVDVDMIMPGDNVKLFEMYNLVEYKCKRALDEMSGNYTMFPINLVLNDIDENNVHIEIIDGRHRCYAAKLHCYQYVPCYLKRRRTI